MSRWHREHPELYDQGYEPWDDLERLGDEYRKESNAPCRVCGEITTASGRPCRRCEASMEHDRLERESGR